MATYFKQTLDSLRSTPVDPLASQFQVPAELQAQLDAIQRRRAAPPPATFSPEQVAQRRADNQTQLELGLLGQLSGNQGLGGAGGVVLKQALAARAPRITEHGSSDQLSGQFTYDPDYLQQRDDTLEEGVQNRIAQMRFNDQQARAAAADRLLQDQQRAREHAELIAATREAKAAAGPTRDYDPVGTNPQGQHIVQDKKSGVSYILTLGPNGVPQYTPYAGQYTPTATFEKNVAAVTQAATSANQAVKTQQEIAAHPDAFGKRAALVSMLPAGLQGYVAPLTGLGSGDIATRANLLRRTAMETNEIYGAAQSAGELARAAAFQPLATDSDEQILAKNAAARDWYQGKAKALGPAALQAALQRSPGLAEGMAAPTPEGAIVPAPGAGSGGPGTPPARVDPLGLFGPKR